MLLHKLKSTVQIAILLSSIVVPLTAVSSFAQALENRIVVLGDAIEEVPADQVTLNVNLSFNDERDVKLVYDDHKQAVQKLTTLLSQLKVPAKDIRFLQLMTRKGRDYQRGQPGERFTSHQRVLIKFTDLNQYTEVQNVLTTNGFADLTAAFSVSNQREIELKLVDRAVARAQEKANRLAKAMSRTIKGIVRISDVGDNEGFYAYRDVNRLNQSQNVANYDSDPVRQMTSVPQLFRYAAAVKVDFELNN